MSGHVSTRTGGLFAGSKPSAALHPLEEVEGGGGGALQSGRGQEAVLDAPDAGLDVPGGACVAHACGRQGSSSPIDPPRAEDKPPPTRKILRVAEHGEDWIENGRLVHPVHEVTIAGNLRDMLRDVDAVGSDLVFRGSSASPTIRIRRVTVSGS